MRTTCTWGPLLVCCWTLAASMHIHLSQAFVPSTKHNVNVNVPAFLSRTRDMNADSIATASNSGVTLSAQRRHNDNEKASQLKSKSSPHNDVDLNANAQQTGTPQLDLFKPFFTALQSGTVAMALCLATLTLTQLPAAAPAASDSKQILSCLLTKCRLPLAKCIANPKCLANVACINTCNNRPDEIECQIKCGDIFENTVVGEFNKCAVSEMDCVKQQADDGSYPVPAPDKVVSKFDTKFFTGRLYITAGQNPLFDVFPCQVHFFSETGKNAFVGKLNWRIEEPDGEFFTRDALQAFVQDEKQPGHLLNHDNEYLHYQDDWWIIDYENDNNPDKIPPFAFIYYRGSNDAWDGYGGVFVYTREAKLPDSLLPRMRAAAAKVNFDFDKDFVVTDNTCPTQSSGDRTLLREQFAGKVALQTEQQVQAQATRLRGNAVNSVKAQKLFFSSQGSAIEKAFNTLEDNTKKFEEEVVRDAIRLEEEVVKDAVKLEQEVVRDGDKLLNRSD